MIRFGCFAAAGVVLALGLSACDDSAANQKANAEAATRAAGAEKAQKLKEGVEHSFDCLSALRWQKAGIAAAGAGDTKVYEAYYREKLEAALGDQTLPAGDDGAPALSKATIQDYADWAYPRTVEAKFRAGKDSNGDGTVSPAERSGRGLNTVAQCVQFVAEMGKGPLAGKDKVARMFRIEALRKSLKDKDA
ncbi:hypothetical protein J2W22_003776 [Sphingomonas kyeonggiensis]|uniref:hypothetical protein n=1 Tax=Sphingomonas kyeonggiensis TaxID=1268553 RepID=UPI0027801F0E|nr:hypothetical protein [Sphingomonas kyeonggiensis]MDQ0251688.1 hypothetical protein [Sphingomonas kyeonggiensis]